MANLVSGLQWAKTAVLGNHDASYLATTPLLPGESEYNWQVLNPNGYRG